MPHLTVISQREFIDSYWAPQPGEHVACIGPTGTGKTTLMMEMLPVALELNPKLRAVVLVMKPHERIEQDGLRRKKFTGDPTVAKFAKKHGAKIVRDWPPPEPLPGVKKPPYYVLWPRHSFDPNKDDIEHHRIFRRAILDCYKRGNWIIVADETYSLAHELALPSELVTVWSKGRSMNTALWGATQRPTYVPKHMYSNSEHLFLWHDPDQSARKRYAEIGGVNPKLVEEVTLQLTRHSALYIRRTDRAMCIVGA